MKPIHLNVASRPWRNTRPFWLTIAALSIATALLLTANAHAAWEYFVETEETRAEIAEIRADAAEMERSAEEVEARLAATNQNLVDARVEYVNARIRERIFSWSQLLGHLERVTPDDVRIRALRPSIDDDGRIMLSMTCTSRTDDGFVEMIRNLTADVHFDRPTPKSESRTEGGAIDFAIDVRYMPDPPGVVVE